MLTRSSMFKYFRAALLVFGLACLPNCVLAINKYRGFPLPDSMLGSTARSLTKVGAGTLGVVGVENTFNGLTDAVYWAVVVGANGEEIFPDKHILPKPAGWNAQATGVAFLEGDPDRPVIVGYIENPINERTRAVIWRRNAMGQFTNTPLDDEAVESQANGISIANTPVGLIIVVCGKFMLPDGSWHAALWKITDAGIERNDLGTLGGPNSEALAVAPLDLNLLGVVGNADRPNGRTLATAWIVSLTGSGGLDWFVRALPTPPGAESSAINVALGDGSVRYIAGYITEPDGRRSASFWINQGETPSTFLSALYQDVLGRRLDTVANGIVGDFDGDGRVDAADFVIGTAQNSSGLQRGVGALPFNQPFNQPFAFDALSRTETVDNNETITVGLNDVEPGGWIAGQGLVQGSSTPQAMLFVPTNDEVPQIISILIGQLQGGQDINDIYLMWQPDGNATTLRPRRQGSMSRIMAEWTSTRTDRMSRAPEKLTIVSRIMPRNMNLSDNLLLTLQLYDPVAMNWVSMSTEVLVLGFYGTGIYRTLEIEIPNPAQFAVASGQPLRWRTILRGEDWRNWQIDLMEMKTMPVAP